MDNDKSFISIVSDMHLAPFDMGADRQQSDSNWPEVRADRLQSVYDQLASGPKPEAILFGGDNANQPVSRPEFRRYAHEFMKKFEAIAPCQAVPGNHDVGSTAGWHHHDPNQLDEACEAFRLDWREWWTLEAAGFKIIGINSQIFGSGLEKEEEQTVWLKERLKEPSQLVRAVFFHTPLYLKTPEDDFDEGSEQMCLKPPARSPLLDVLRECPPDLVITTHAHRYWTERQETWDWIGVSATALGQHEMDAVPSVNLPEGDDHPGWVDISIGDGGTWTSVGRYC